MLRISRLTFVSNAASQCMIRADFSDVTRLSIRRCPRYSDGQCICNLVRGMVELARKTLVDGRYRLRRGKREFSRLGTRRFARGERGEVDCGFQRGVADIDLLTAL